MNPALKLLFRNTLKKDKARLLCACFGITAAITLLTWSIGLAVCSWNQCRPLSERMGKPFDCWVATNRASGAAPKGTGMQRLAHGSPFKMIPNNVVEAVKASEDIERALTTTVFRCRIDWRPEGRPLQGPGVGGGIAPARDFPEGCPYPEGLLTGRWPNPEATIPEFVISPRAFGGLENAPPINTRLPIITPTGHIEAILCGYLSPEIQPVAGFPTLFASDNLANATALVDTQGGTNLILINLKKGHTSEQLAEIVRTISPDDDAACLISREALLKQLRNDTLTNLLRQLPLMVSLAIVATLCMIVNALSIGIEQNHILHIRLRALGMSLQQLTSLIRREAYLLATIGGCFGMLLGGFILAIFVYTHPLTFPDGLMLSWGTPLIILLLLLLTTHVATLFPIGKLRKQKPFETSRPLININQPLRQGLQLFRAFVGLLPILLTPILFKNAAIRCSLWFFLFALPCAIIAIIQLSKHLLPLIERLSTPLLSTCLRLRPELLRHILSRHSMPNRRMVLTLTTGLGAFFAIHIWGASLTEPFIPSRELPQAVVTLLPNGVSPEMSTLLMGKEGALPGLETLSYIPLSANQYPLLEADYQAIKTRTGHLPKQNNILLLASQSDHCILDNSRPEGVTITDMFSRHTGLNVGDTFTIQRKDAQGVTHQLPLTITHILRCNWHLFSSRAGFRGRNGAPVHTLGPVFIPWHLAEQWDPEQHQRICFLWLNGLPSDAAEEALYTVSERIETHFRALVQHDPKPYINKGWRDAPSSHTPIVKRSIKEARNKKRTNEQPIVPNVTVRLRDEISDGTLAHSTELLGEMARIPLWSLLILSTGFISLLTANVRANAGELRTLHAIGMTRAQMGRFLFAQALMISFTATILSLILGASIGWGFTGWTLANMPFGGLPSVFILPMGRVLEGLGILLLSIFILTPLPISYLLKRLLK